MSFKRQIQEATFEFVQFFKNNQLIIYLSETGFWYSTMHKFWNYDRSEAEAWLLS